MKCWACQTKMICGDSRPLYEGRQRYRRYDCPKCGESTCTLEKIITLEERANLPLRAYWRDAKRHDGTR